MRAGDEVRVGIVGMGFMGRTHARAYARARATGLPVRLVAVADHDPARLEPDAATRAAPGGVAADAPALAEALAGAERHVGEEELLARTDLDLVSICTHTDSHVELARTALAAGLNVLLEKPVALRSDAVEELLEAEAAAPGFCMPAMCMRFWPGWSTLRDAVRDGRYGALASATFLRLSSPPSWSQEFYLDRERSGGVLFDLHVHDADLVGWLLGRPDAVETSGRDARVLTRYHYADGPGEVSAEGSWDQRPEAPFRMEYVLAFERATLRFALDREPCARVEVDGRERPLELLEHERSGAVVDGYEGEVRHALAAVGGAPLEASLAEALALTRTLEAEALSLRTGRPVHLAFGGAAGR